MDMHKILTIVVLVMCHFAGGARSQEEDHTVEDQISLHSVTRYCRYNNGDIIPMGGNGLSISMTGMGGGWPGGPSEASPVSIPLANLASRFEEAVAFPAYKREWFYPPGEPAVLNAMITGAWARNLQAKARAEYFKQENGYQRAKLEHVRTWVTVGAPRDHARTFLLKVTRKITVDGGAPVSEDSFLPVTVPEDDMRSSSVDFKPGGLKKLVNNVVVETPFTEKYIEEISVSLLRVEVRVTDVTGFRGIGATPASAVPRIPATREADGIACDWREDVNDGAMLLIRFVGPTENEFTVEFGRHDPGFVAGLPTGPARDGEYIEVNSTDETHLRDLGLKVKGEEFDTGRTVYDMRLYKPATEFDLATPQSPQKFREVKLAVKATGTGGSTGLEIDMERKLTLTRPPLVLVHGVNSEPTAWNNFSKAFEEEWGFVCDKFRVDHSGEDPTRPSELDTYGFGEISSTCHKVSDMVTWAKGRFHNRIAFPKRIAVQKVDVVAHSYGGLLTRWYTEMAGIPEGKEFADRRDIRKIITLGTPHKGSPLANMVCEVFANPLIGSATSEGVGSLEYSMANLLAEVDVPGIGTGGWLKKQLPNALTAARNAPRHAYQVFSVNSQRLAALNTSPLHDDVGYAAISGTQEHMFGLVDYKSFVPNYDPVMPGDVKPYFPWLDHFIHDGTDLDGTDAIVPKWSSKISNIAADYYEVHASHIELSANRDVMEKCCEWLNRKLSRGIDHRGSWIDVPVSERNAYKGSTVGAGGVSTGGGLRSEAIVNVELKSGWTTPYTLSTDAATVGIKEATLTGMIKVSSIGSESFVLVADELSDNPLNNIGVQTAAELSISAADMSGAGPDHYVPFSRKHVQYGRLHDNEASGPHGTSDDDDTVLIAYEQQGVPEQSPPAVLVLPDYVLDPPVKSGLNLSLSGAVEVSGAGSGSQSVETRVYDQDPLADDLLETKVLSLAHPAGVWNDVLVPYHTTISLFTNGTGHVAGAHGDSGENPAQVYQYLVRPGMSSNEESTTVDVP